MAKISNSKPKESSGAYERIFGNKELGDLITRVHSTSITNGNELEKIILNHCKDNNYLIEDFDDFIENSYSFINTDNIIKVVRKKVIKKSQILQNISKKKDNVNFEPDFVVLKIDKNNKCCYVIELKDGFEFDTKKISGERQHLEEFANFIAKKIPYCIFIKFCCFNENDKKKIKNGLKGEFEIEEIMTGNEFCDLLNINYKEIIELRKADVEENIEFFVKELLKIENVRKLVEKYIHS